MNAQRRSSGCVLGTVEKGRAMADLQLNWSGVPASAGLRTGLQDGTPGVPNFSVDTGGVAVDVHFDQQLAGSGAIFFRAPAFVGADEGIANNSHLKLFGAVPGAGAAPRQDSSKTELVFRSTNDAYSDQVQNVTFRLNDIDQGRGDDFGTGAEPDSFRDDITVRAFNADGQEIFTRVISGAGRTAGNPETAANSELISIAGPVARVVLESDTTGGAYHGVLVSDVHFSTVDADDDDPNAVDDSADTDFEQPILIDVLDNDSDPQGQTLTLVGPISVPAGRGTAEIVGDQIRYTPPAGFSGDVTFNYTVRDPDGNEDTAQVTVRVGDEDNTAPDAADDVAMTMEGEAVVIRPLSNDSDPQEDPLTITSLGTPTNGTATLNPDGSVTYTPNAGFTGTEVIPYTISDGNGGTDTADITVYVRDPDAVDGRIDTDVFPVPPAVDPLLGRDQDPDPDNDRDLVTGNNTDEVFRTGDDADTINAGGGNDTVFSGIDDDQVILGDGNDFILDEQGADTIYGGAGNDTIYAGVDTFSDYAGDAPAFPIPGFDRDLNTDDGRDSISGGGGNDIIFTGDDRDTIDGGVGNDTINSGIDDDSVRGGDGDDSILAGHGSDTVDGGAGDDLIDGRIDRPQEIPDATDRNALNDRDSLLGGHGDDTLLGGDDDDTLRGGADDDLLDGGIDEDSLDGGAGEDTLIGGAGADSIHGGADADRILVRSADEGNGDTIHGGSAGNDYDVLDLTGAGTRGTNWRLTNVTEDSDGNGMDGRVEFLADDGSVSGGMDFFNIERVVPCFTPGTLIATPEGERLIEDLQVGDRVITRDNGIQEIRWMGRKDLSSFELTRKPHLNPVLIQKGALGKNLPEHDILVSPNHRVLVSNDKAALYFEEREVLVAAKHLTSLDGVDEVISNGVAYIHIMFDQHEVVLSNGAWTESFQPGDYSLRGIGDAQRAEILELFPELEHADGIKGYASARRSLKRHEAALLLS